MAVKVSKLSINFESGTERKTVYANWTHSEVKRKAKGTDTKSASKKGNKDRRLNYSYKWYYLPGTSKRWLLTGEGTVSTSRADLPKMSVPDNANKIKISVKINSKSYKDSKKKEHKYFTSDWVTKEFNVSKKTPPQAPGVPTVTMYENKKKVRIESTLEFPASGINKPKQATFAVFDCTMGGPSIAKCSEFYDATVSSIAKTASVNFNLVKGKAYSFNARCIDEDNNASPWSGWSHISATGYLEALPEKPDFKSVVVDAYNATNNLLKFSWTKPSYGVTDYELEIAESPQYFGTSMRIGIEKYETEDVKSYAADRKYAVLYFRVRATNHTGYSDWSNTKSIILGRKPGIPTSWSLKSTLIEGNSINLYWTHNSLDNSPEKTAQLVIAYDDGTTETYDITKTTDPDHEYDTSVYTFTPKACSFKWKVRTKGVHPDYSDYSMERRIEVYARPTVTLRMLDAQGVSENVLRTFPFTIAGEAGPSTQKALGIYVDIVSEEEYTLTNPDGSDWIVNIGDSVYSKIIEPDALNTYNLPVTAGDILLNNNTTYKLKVTASMSSGLSANASMLFTTDFSSDEFSLDISVGAGQEDATIVDYDNGITTSLVPYAFVEHSHRTIEEIIDGYSEEDGIFTESGYYVARSGMYDVTFEDPAYMRPIDQTSIYMQKYGSTISRIQEIIDFIDNTSITVSNFSDIFEFQNTTGATAAGASTDVKNEIINLLQIISSLISYFFGMDAYWESPSYHEFDGMSLSDAVDRLREIMYQQGNSTLTIHISGVKHNQVDMLFYNHFHDSSTIYKKLLTPVYNITKNDSLPLAFNKSDLSEDKYYVALYSSSDKIQFTVFNIRPNPLEIYKSQNEYVCYYYGDGPTADNTLPGTLPSTDTGKYKIGDIVYVYIPSSSSAVMCLTEMELTDIENGRLTWTALTPEKSDTIDYVEYRDNIYIDVYRKEYNGKLTLIETDLISGDETTVIDPHPNLNYVQYRLVGRSMETGTMVIEDVPPIEIGVKSIVIQWAEKTINFLSEDDILEDDVAQNVGWYGSILKLPYNIDISFSNSRDVKTVEYIGREHPVSYYGTQLGETGTWKTEIPKYDKETLFQIRRLSVYQGDCYVREPSGTGYWAYIDVTYDVNHNALTVPITFNVTRVEGGK